MVLPFLRSESMIMVSLENEPFSNCSSSCSLFEHEQWPYGAPQSASSHQLSKKKKNDFIEAAPTHPILASTVEQIWCLQQDFMSNLKHLSFLLAYVDGYADHDEGGQVSLHNDGRVRIDYPISSKCKSLSNVLTRLCRTCLICRCTNCLYAPYKSEPHYEFKHFHAGFSTLWFYITVSLQHIKWVVHQWVKMEVWVWSMKDTNITVSKTFSL